MSIALPLIVSSVELLAVELRLASLGSRVVMCKGLFFINARGDNVVS